MDVSKAVEQRISTRAFTPDALDEAEVRDWLAKAQRAPSGGNTQPWRVIVVTGDARDEVIAKAAPILRENHAGQPTDRPIYPKDLWEPHEARRRRVGEMMYEALGIPKSDRPARIAWFSNNFKFFGAPVGLFLVIDERMGHGQWGHAGMYLQTLALLAEERGWGTCMQECWGVLRPMLKAHFELGETEMVWCGMAVGHPDRSHPVNTLRAERASVDEIADLRGF
ncbi:nitroreductase [Hyphomonas johnsonii]|uniref:Nitroreductase family protein n=1 Tax=Hyphomonas johnsonii MHS-2 TaxID=1280950 RepID=A0A059FV97_9PROT|nr:nitroreductase [Hyphomonas johnsonii]KCZ94615.1 nitroreductase family protein [Hyphomonas johnsonii MHS-2]